VKKNSEGRPNERFGLTKGGCSQRLASCSPPDD
jgi:hypothetical protein